MSQNVNASFMILNTIQHVNGFDRCYQELSINELGKR